ncbi:SsgA family sporulation/cell division regulator [Herbidospora galbida]|uniref:SsgA family sporulation/cell division regulator n=1 Tax=Herbidospora galbida TaxID=2575442 RepID=A0A4U3MLU3_9ACTN|nr:SsgA family sporulation/cell division regulator [Herbidospora galbida]
MSGERPSEASMNNAVVHCLTLYYGTQYENSVASFVRYRPTDPFFVSVDIPGHSLQIDMTRSTLSAGLNAPTESGHVLVGPSEDREWTIIRIRIPDGNELLFCTSRALVGEFLAETYQAVPMGQENEQINWDIAHSFFLHESE